MLSKLLVKVKCLKDFLSLFDGDKCLENLILGDTWHPSSGFVDENILDGKRGIKEILEFSYEFDGLVEFSASIENISFRLKTYSDNLEEYEVFGAKKDLYKLYNKAIEENGYCPDKYQLRFMYKKANS